MVDHKENELDEKLLSAVFENLPEPNAARTTADVMRRIEELEAPAGRWARLREVVPCLAPPPGLVAASFGALLIITPIAIAKWPTGTDSFDRTVLAMATGDPLAMDSSLSFLLGNRSKEAGK